MVLDIQRKVTVVAFHNYSAKIFVHNTLLQIFTFLRYFGELIVIGMRQDMVDATVDLVKEGRVEITF